MSKNEKPEYNHEMWSAPKHDDPISVLIAVIAVLGAFAAGVLRMLP